MSSLIELSQYPPFRCGSLFITPSLRRIVHDDGRELIIEPRIMQVLCALHIANGTILSRADLIRSCWEGRTVSKDAVHRAISLLRALANGIGDDSFRIDTVSKVGYRLVELHSDDVSAGIIPPQQTWPRRRLIVTGGIFAAALGGAGLYQWFHGHASGSYPTIAVMPFETATTVPDYLKHAAAFEIRQSLSRIAGLRVLSDASTFSVARLRLSPRQLGQRLGAGLLVFGRIMPSGTGFQGSVELVDAATQAQRVAFTQTVSTDDIPALTDALSGRIVEYVITTMAPSLLSSKLPPPVRGDPRAFPHMAAAEQAFLLTRALMADNNMGEANVRADLAYAQAKAALAIDGSNVRSLLVLWGLARNGWSARLQSERPPDIDRTSFALNFVQRALAADPNDPAALAALGDSYRRYQWRWHEAEALLSRAIQADPGQLEARWAYATLLGTLNRAPEGIAHAREVALLDPENATRRGYILPRLNFAAGNRAQALHQYDGLLSRTPLSTFVMRELYMTYLTAGNAAALDGLIVRIRQLPKPYLSAARERVERTVNRIAAASAALRGRPQHLRQIVHDEVAEMDGDQRTEEGRVDGDRLFLASLEYAWAEETDGAIDLLARALAARSLNWIAALPYGVAPFPPSVRNHARFIMLWNSDERLAGLIKTRQANLANGKARGSMPIAPKIQ